MDQSLLHIGGGRLQLPAIRWARDAGLEVIVTDVDPDAPGRSAAHRFECIASEDTKGLVTLARELDGHGTFAGAYAPDRTGVAAVAAIGEATGTPTNSIHAVARALDRGASLARLSAAGIAVALPDSPDLLNSPNSPGEPLAEYDVDAVIRDGTFLEGGLVRRVQTSDGVAEFGFMEAAIDQQTQRSIYGVVESAARKLDLTVGPIGARVSLHPGSGGHPIPRIHEILPCLRAEVTNNITPLAVGKSPAQAWFASLRNTGGPFDSMPAHTGDDTPSAGWMAIRARDAGVYAGIEGLDRARATPGIRGLCIVAKNGDELPDPRDERSLVGYLYATGWDLEQVESQLRAARDRVQVHVVHAGAA